MEGKLACREGNSSKNKEKNWKFYFAKVEALVTTSQILRK